MVWLSLALYLGEIADPKIRGALVMFRIFIFNYLEKVRFIFIYSPGLSFDVYIHKGFYYVLLLISIFPELI